MQGILYIRDRDGAFIATDTGQAVTSVSLQPYARWNSSDPDQHGSDPIWSYDDQRSIAVSPLGCIMLDGSVWTFHGVHFAEGEMRVFVSPLTFADPFAEGQQFTFAVKGREVRHGMQLIATATSGSYARRIAEALTRYKGQLSRDRKRAAGKGQ